MALTSDRDRIFAVAFSNGHGGTEMARYHFRLTGADDVIRTLVTADLDSPEEVMDRAEVLGRLLLLTQDDWYTHETDTREIIVTDDKGFDLLTLRLSNLLQS